MDIIFNRQTILLEPLTSKETIGRGSISIPKDAIDEVIHALKEAEVTLCVKPLKPQ